MAQRLGVLLVFLTPAYTTFSQSFACKKPLLSTGQKRFFLFYRNNALTNGKTVKFLDDNATYLGSQLKCEFGGKRCFGLAANMDFLLVCSYEENGENPELIVYRKR